MSTVTIAVVDDHPIVRAGIRELLLENERIAEVITFNDAEAFLAALDRGVRADACLLDLELPGMGGLEALGELRIRWPELPVIVLTAQPASAVTVRCLRAGAKGFLSKGQDPSELFAAIETVLNGRRAVDPAHLEIIIDAVEQPDGILPHERLSDREYEIMIRIARGVSLQQIATDLCINPKTVSTYRRRALAKMGFDRNAQITEYALKYLGTGTLS